MEGEGRGVKIMLTFVIEKNELKGYGATIYHGYFHPCKIQLCFTAMLYCLALALCTFV